MLVVIGFKAKDMLSAPSQTRYILNTLTWAILAQTCILRDTHAHTRLRCRLAFRAHCVSWKIGLKAEPVARQLICLIWYFFFLLVLFSFSHTQYKLFAWYFSVRHWNFKHIAHMWSFFLLPVFMLIHVSHNSWLVLNGAHYTVQSPTHLSYSKIIHSHHFYNQICVLWSRNQNHMQ